MNLKRLWKLKPQEDLILKESKLREKITQIIALLIPIFLISITRAEELSDAMEARGYILGAKRTRIDEFKIKPSDVISLVFSVLVITTIITFRIIL